MQPTFFKPLRLSRFAAAALLFTSAGALAQEKTPPADAPLQTAPVPFKPQIDDPMLTPLARPEKQVATWAEARSLLLERSTDLRSAEAGVVRAEGRWRQSLSSLLPNASLSASAGINLLDPSSPPLMLGAGADSTTPLVTGSVSVTQSLINVPAWRGLSSSAAGERSAEATLAETHRRLTQGLASSLVAVVAAERAAEINRISLRQALERAALAERTQQLGAGTQLDVVRVQQDVAVARGALISGDEQVRRTREALGLALGFEHEVGVRGGFALDGLVEQTQQLCSPLSSPSDRPDLVAAREQTEAALQARRQASAGYLPTLGLNSSLLALTTDPGPGRLANWSLSAVLSVPLWEGGFRGGLVSERRGVEQQTAQQAEELRRSVTVEVSRARRNVDVAEQLVKSATQARDLAQDSDRLTQRSFEIGRATSLELVQSAVVLRQAELSLALREFEWVQARLDAFLTEARCDG